MCVHFCDLTLTCCHRNVVEAIADAMLGAIGIVFFDQIQVCTYLIKCVCISNDTNYVHLINVTLNCVCDVIKVCARSIA